MIFFKYFIKLLFASIFFISSQSIAITAQDIENADPSGQTVEFWVQYSDERLDAMMARAERFEAETGIKVNVVHKGHYGKVQSAMMSAAGTKDIADVARGYGNAAADMYLIGASIDQSMLANSKKWGVTQDDIDDWGANWTVGYSPYFDGNPKLLHEVGKSIEILYYNADWLKELGLNEPKSPADFAKAACAATNQDFSGKMGDDVPSYGYEIDTDASNFAAWVFAHGGDVLIMMQVNIFIMDQKPLKLWSLFKEWLTKDVLLLQEVNILINNILDKDQCYLPLVQLQELHTLKNQ